MTNAEKLTLKKHACHIRMGVIEGTHSAGCGHPGGSLSIADVLSYLYFKELNVDPAQPRMADRDRLVLSTGFLMYPFDPLRFSSLFSETVFTFYLYCFPSIVKIHDCSAPLQPQRKIRENRPQQQILSFIWLL